MFYAQLEPSKDTDQPANFTKTGPDRDVIVRRNLLRGPPAGADSTLSARLPSSVHFLDYDGQGRADEVDSPTYRFMRMAGADCARPSLRSDLWPCACGAVHSCADGHGARSDVRCPC